MLKENNMLVPKLRFKEFNDEWISKKLGDIGISIIGLTYNPNNINSNGVIVLKSNNIKNGKLDLSNMVRVNKKITPNLYIQNEDILICSRNGSSQLVGKCCIIKSKNELMTFGAFMTVFRSQYNKFIYQLMNTINYRRQVLKNNGTTINQITNNDLNNFSFYLPSLEEQTKIADFLSLIDRKIEIQEKLVENLKLYKKGLIQKIFKNECQNVLLSSLLIEKNNKNSIGLEVCSVAVEKGVVNQVEHLGRSFSAKDTSKYNRVSYGNLVYTKSPTGLFPYGIIKQSYKKNDVAVSPLYAIYNPITFNVGVLINSFFEYPINTNNYLHSLIQKGAKNTINISNSRFLEKSIPMPNDNSLIDKYANLIIAINDKISYETKKLHDLKTYKKGLLQQMFI